MPAVAPDAMPDEPGWPPNPGVGGSVGTGGVAVLAGSAAGLLVLGAASAVLGGLMLLWPQATVSVVAVLIGVQFLVHGVVRLGQAVASSGSRIGTRILLAMLGLLSLVVGVLCLQHRQQTVAALALLVGLVWLAGGLLELARAVTERGPGSGLAALSGLFGVLAGVVVISWPRPTVLVLAVLVGLWLLAFGLVMVVSGIRAARHPARRRR